MEHRRDPDHEPTAVDVHPTVRAGLDRLRQAPLRVRAGVPGQNTGSGPSTPWIASADGVGKVGSQIRTSSNAHNA